MGTASKQRIFFHVVNKVIHPAHIPLHIESQAVILYAAGNLWPGCGFLRDQKRVRMLFLKDGIQMLQEFNGFQILIASVDVRNPLPVILTVVQIQHGSNRIHTDTICMEFLHPEKRVGYEEIPHLRSSVIVDQSSPMGMHALPGVQMLIQTGPVEVWKARCVFREMGRHPVQDHTDSLLVQIVHEIHKILTGSISAGRRIISRHLISPGSIKGMLHNRHKLYVCVPHIF